MTIVQRFLEATGWSQRRLARAAGVSDTVVHRAKKGTPLSVKNAKKIAGASDGLIDAASLVIGSEPAPPEGGEQA